MTYFDPYDFYEQAPLSDENMLSSQLWDLYAPTSDTQAWNRINAAYPYMKGFSTDALLQTDPLIRGTVAQAIAEAGSGVDAPFQAYNLLQSDDYQDQLQEMLGTTEWNQIAGRGDIGTLIAQATGDSEATDAAAMDYTNRMIENFYEQAAPTAARNMNMLDEGQQRFGGRPYPGGGGQQYTGPAFQSPMQGNDPLQALAMSPQYANAEVAGVVDANMLPDVGDNEQYSAGSREMYGNEPILDLGKAEVDQNRIVEGGPEGYSRVAVIGGRKYALPDTLPGIEGTSISYMRELRRRAEEAGLELGSGDRLIVPESYGRGDDDERNEAPPGSFANRILDMIPGRKTAREWIADRFGLPKLF